MQPGSGRKGSVNDFLFAEYEVERLTHVMQVEGAEPDWWDDEIVALQIAQRHRLVFDSTGIVQRLTHTVFRQDDQSRWIEFHVIRCRDVQPEHVETVNAQIGSIRPGTMSIRVPYDLVEDLRVDRDGRDIQRGDTVIIELLTKSPQFEVVRVDDMWAILREPDSTIRNFFMPRNALRRVRRAS